MDADSARIFRAWAGRPARPLARGLTRARAKVRVSLRQGGARRERAFPSAGEGVRHRGRPPRAAKEAKHPQHACCSLIGRMSPERRCTVAIVGCMSLSNAPACRARHGGHRGRARPPPLRRPRRCRPRCAAMGSLASRRATLRPTAPRCQERAPFTGPHPRSPSPFCNSRSRANARRARRSIGLQPAHPPSRARTDRRLRQVRRRADRNITSALPPLPACGRSRKRARTPAVPA